MMGSKLAGLVALLFAASTVFGTPIPPTAWTSGGETIGDESGGNAFSITRMDYAVPGDGYLWVRMRTGFYGGGAGTDSYGAAAPWSYGDLYLHVDAPLGGGFQSIVQGDTVYEHPTGSSGYNYSTNPSSTGRHVIDGRGNLDVFGLGLKNRVADDVTLDPHDGTANDSEFWDTAVSEGTLYSDAVFATGTYEYYEMVHPEVPSDGDPSDALNTYPTMLMHGQSVSVLPGLPTYVNWHDIQGTPGSSNYLQELIAGVPLQYLGIDPGTTHSVQAFWAMECGNDGAQIMWSQEFQYQTFIPEPCTFAFLGFGGLLLCRRRRK